MKFINKKILSVVLVAGYTLLGMLWWQMPDDQFHIWFLDVGQGDSIFIKTPENHQILVDGGSKNFVIEELSDVMPFFDKTIDMMVLTHPHADHIDGLVEVLKRYEVGVVLFTGVSFDNPMYEEFLVEVDGQGLTVYIAESGVDFLLGNVLMDVVYPLKSILGEHFKNVNNSSIGMVVSYDGRRVVLTGDMEVEAEEELLASGFGGFESEVYKAGHHGSKTASSEEFLRAIRPENVVIQVGEGNSFGHPHAEALRNFHRTGVRKIYRNDLDGRVEFIF